MAKVSASLLVAEINDAIGERSAVSDLYSRACGSSFGWINGHFVSNTASYEQNGFVDGVCPFVWRSGVKHDCSKIMELTLKGDSFVNGLGEIVDVEEECIYPLIKSSNIKSSEIHETNHYFVITQHNTSDNTELLKCQFPKLYRYLEQHESHFAQRGSVIYKNKPRFCLFGIGNYSIKPYKVVVSGLYKHTRFAFVDTIENKPTMIDDACYMIGFDSKEDAMLETNLLNNTLTQEFLSSISFEDDKRMISKDLLMRIDLFEIARRTMDSFSYAQFEERFAEPTLFNQTVLNF